MSDLPYIDEHHRRIEAAPEAVWDALVRFLGRSRTSGGPLPRLLGCEPARGTARFDGRVGDAIPGFVVTAVEPGRRLELRGRHRFADYALTFVLDDDRLRAVTHAAFPGFRGRLYRAAVIGSGGHALVARWVLRRIGRMAR